MTKFRACVLAVLASMLLAVPVMAQEVEYKATYTAMAVMDSLGLILIIFAVYYIIKTMEVYGGLVGRGFKVIGAGIIVLFISRLSSHVVAYYGIAPIPHLWEDVLYLIAFILLTVGFYLTCQAAVKIRKV